MAKVTVEELKAQLDRINEIRRDRAERIANCEVESTDCALSIMADREQADLINAQIEIIENGGTSWFQEYATLDGVLVDGRWVDTRYGYKLVCDMPDGETVWTTANTEKGLARRGLKKVMVRRTAWAKLASNGSSIASGCYVKRYPALLNRATGEYSETFEAIEVKEYDWTDC